MKKCYLAQVSRNGGMFEFRNRALFVHLNDLNQTGFHEGYLTSSSRSLFNRLVTVIQDGEEVSLENGYPYRVKGIVFELESHEGPLKSGWGISLRKGGFISSWYYIEGVRGRVLMSFCGRDFVRYTQIKQNGHLVSLEEQHNYPLKSITITLK